MQDTLVFLVLSLGSFSVQALSTTHTDSMSRSPSYSLSAGDDRLEGQGRGSPQLRDVFSNGGGS